MKRKISQVALILSTVILTFSMNGCKSAVKDADLETSVENSIKNNPDLTGIAVDVKDGVATLSGRVTSESAKSAAATAASGIKGVKSVNNNIRVETTAPVEINADETLRNSVRDAIKDHPGVTVDVNDGVITVTGEIKRADLPTLMQKLNALNPKKVENKLTIK